MSAQIPSLSLHVILSLTELDKGDFWGCGEHCFHCLDADPHLQKFCHRKRKILFKFSGKAYLLGHIHGSERQKTDEEDAIKRKKILRSLIYI